MAEAAQPDPPTEVATANRKLWAKVSEGEANCSAHTIGHSRGSKPDPAPTGAAPAQHRLSPCSTHAYGYSLL